MSRLAEDLGAGEVIAKSETAVMEKDGKLMRFNIMEGAKGISMGDMDDKLKEMKNEYGIDIQLEYTSEALNQLTKMQILDLISGQIDRNTNNYFVEYFEDPQHPEVWKITNIKGIDNDLSFGMIPGQEVIDHGTGRAGSLVDKKYNTVSIPFIEAEFWEQIQKYTKDAAIFSQADLRTEEEINFMWERFETVKSELEKLIRDERLQVILDYIDKNGYEQRSCANTAVAARDVAREKRLNVAAICSKGAAEQYGLKVLDSHLQSDGGNTTRFIVISKELIIPDGANKVSLCFSLPHVQGSLYTLLCRFNSLGLNLTKIESRPIPGKDFEYLFYLDFSGNVHSDSVTELLSQLKEEMPEFSFLGNYNEESV